MSFPHILITNSVPLNGGDEALLHAAIEGIMNRWPECSIKILCSQVERSRQYLPHLNLYPDLEYVERSRLRRLLMRLFWHLRKLGSSPGMINRIESFTASPERQKLLNLYQEADLVVSSPGGFLHDFYLIEDRLRGFEVALGYGKPLVFMAQSIGPFWKPQSIVRMRHILRQATRICVRDEASWKHLEGLGLDMDKVEQTADMAFLLYEKNKYLVPGNRKEPRRIGLCFRAWPVGDSVGRQHIIEKAQALAGHLLTNKKRSLYFLSTCQGITNYVDDSKLALDIIKGLSDHERQRCTVDRRRYTPHQLIKRYSTCDAFVGMRLHGSILAMLGGTPAFGLGYEDKTKEIFGQMGLSDYQIHFNSPLDQWISKVDKFLEANRDLYCRLPDTLTQQYKRAIKNLDVVDEILRNIATRP
ncbi:MAG: polysaccharide pyruvyl transferase family protein [Proteobacteria bacterium]|nr:polysaccharide pyruvyl transferase family protein [Pseudomonadota bacterium]